MSIIEIIIVFAGYAISVSVSDSWNEFISTSSANLMIILLLLFITFIKNNIGDGDKTYVLKLLVKTRLEIIMINVFSNVFFFVISF